MGRRSINTTKSGKYMNPTDQARKEARKRELKKNKKQRQMVRAAVLKGKDPMQIISDMEKIDEMEYCVVSPPLLNEKVLKDKRKKLKETWDRVMRLYSKEDRDRFLELKKLEIEYESRRCSLMKYFESVRVAQQVQIDEIPLPSTPDMPSFLTSQIPLPNELGLTADQMQAPPSILKKNSAYYLKEAFSKELQPPGVPPGPPPLLSSDEEDEDEDDRRAREEDMMVDEELEGIRQDSKHKSRKIRFADETAKGKKADHDADTQTGDAKEKSGVEEMLLSLESTTNDSSSILKPEDIPVPPIHQVPLPSGPPPRLPQGPPPMLFRASTARLGVTRLLPPGVPPPPPGRPTLPPLRLGAPPIRLPPGPPPGIPPLRLIRPPSLLPSRLSGNPQLEPSTAVVSAPPSLMQRPKALAHPGEAKHSATIEAKPQIRNLSADLMRFTPTTLRVKREDRHKKGTGKAGAYETSKESYPTTAPMSNPSIAPTKDDAYQQFLREMEELL